MSRRKIAVIVVLWVVSGGLLMGAVVTRVVAYARRMAAEANAPAIQMTAKGLMAVYRENPASFMEKHNGRFVEITGEVKEISERWLVLVAGRSERLTCYFANPRELTSLRAGQSITVTGKVDSWLGSPVLRDAMLTANSADTRPWRPDR